VGREAFVVAAMHQAEKQAGGSESVGRVQGEATRLNCLHRNKAVEQEADSEGRHCVCQSCPGHIRISSG
jgi:hypothetical protein